MAHLRAALAMLVLFTVLCGFVYPVVVTGIGQLLFPGRASGSLVERGGRVVGSELIGQPFDDPRYFHGRPSATAAMPYDASSSSGSNAGPTSPELARAVEERRAAVRAENAQANGSVPIDLVTTSASGLDPHISPAAARYQVARVARARGLPPGRVRALVEEHIEEPTFGVLGEPRVNVLLVNLALDRLSAPD